MLRKICQTLAFMSLLPILGCSQEQAGLGRSTLDRINSTHKLRVGYIVFPPTVTKDPNSGELRGHHVAAIREIARLSNWQLEFVETDWSTFPAGLAAGRFDVSIAPTFVTIPRAEAVAFTRPLFFAGNSALVRKTDNRFSSIETLDREGITIAVTQGEAGHEYAKANFKKAKLLVFSGSDQSLAFQNVLTGRADVALGDAYVTAQFAKQHEDAVRDLFATKPYNLTPVSWAVRPGDLVFLAFLNSSLDALDYQGRLQEFESDAGAHWLHLKKDWEQR
ncbi:MAG TPA: ABC transporter substrate-binding protein [Thermoanaerobaculia bacterium]|jgi:polar amino acid transport system substrate-binding protein|nr:ABC transporter substrate-binding protein [Thermoanaerobaculia bacterium]